MEELEVIGSGDCNSQNAEMYELDNQQILDSMEKVSEQQRQIEQAQRIASIQSEIEKEERIAEIQRQLLEEQKIAQKQQLTQLNEKQLLQEEQLAQLNERKLHQAANANTYEVVATNTEVENINDLYLQTVEVTNPIKMRQRRIDIILRDIEDQRKKSVLSFLIGLLGISISSFLVFKVSIIAGIIVAILGVIFIKKSEEEYIVFNDQYKNELVRSVMEEFFDQVVFSEDSGISRESIDVSRFFTKEECSNIVSYNGMSGIYNDVKMYTAKLKLSHVKRIESKNEKVTSFEGTISYFIPEKRYMGAVWIASKEAYVKSNFHARERVKQFDDIEFSNGFVVNATSEEDAYAFLTDEMMNRIKLLNNRKSGLLMFSVVNGIGYIIEPFNKKDRYEPSRWKRVKLDTVRDAIESETRDIRKCIDVLNVREWH